MNTPPCTIGILRPRGTSILEASDEFDESADVLSDELQEMLLEAGERAKKVVQIFHFQFFAHNGKEIEPSKSRRQAWAVNDILVAIDPPEYEAAGMIGRLGMKPIQRSVIAFTNRDDCVEHGQRLCAPKLPILQGNSQVTRSALQQVFIVHIPPNEEERALQYQNSLQILQSAIEYPNIASREVAQDRFSPRIFLPPQ